MADTPLKFDFIGIFTNRLHFYSVILRRVESNSEIGFYVLVAMVAGQWCET
jgi:hypothetical protein